MLIYKAPLYSVIPLRRETTGAHKTQPILQEPWRTKTFMGIKMAGFVQT